MLRSMIWSARSRTRLPSPAARVAAMRYTDSPSLTVCVTQVGVGGGARDPSGTATIIPSGKTPLDHGVPSGAGRPRLRSMIVSRRPGSPSRAAIEYGVSRPFDRRVDGPAATDPATAPATDPASVISSASTGVGRYGPIDPPPWCGTTTTADEIIATRTSPRTHPVGDGRVGRSDTARGARRQRTTRATSLRAVTANHTHSSRNTASPICTTASVLNRPLSSAPDSDPRSIPTSATVAIGTPANRVSRTRAAPRRVTVVEISRTSGGVLAGRGS